ncbi:MAG: methylmalonyl Co-A mutase-associated GTPase MeaB [Alphaproteobacteria bacterium]|nr:methylmalonyl Co-A mutase-associated GTPase MeaB [Alphaproteobacteria bacterium]
MEDLDPSRLAAAVLAGERRALARAITLIESSRPDHREKAEALLDALLPEAGRSVRLGISGAPGVGKSTFIEAFGRHIIEAGHRVAVLAVDPSSRRSGGSILGDKTRMEALARDAGAFIRPSPAGRTLGGVARRTREAMLACEAAGFDVVLVETVGVGQSETTVADMVDLFLLLLQPAGGDELQGIKRGIVELADLVLVNKADGALEDQARRTAADYGAALHLLRPAAPGWTVRVQICSAQTGAGIPEAWDAVGAFREILGAGLEERRARQAVAWMWNEVAEGALEALRRDDALRALAGRLEGEVAAGRAAPAAAARRLLARFLARS